MDMLHDGYICMEGCVCYWRFGASHVAYARHVANVFFYVEMGVKGAGSGGGLDVWGVTSRALMMRLVITPRRICASGVKQLVLSVVVVVIIFF